MPNNNYLSINFSYQGNNINSDKLNEFLNNNPLFGNIISLNPQNNNITYNLTDAPPNLWLLLQNNQPLIFGAKYANNAKDQLKYLGTVSFNTDVQSLYSILAENQPTLSKIGRGLSNFISNIAAGVNHAIGATLAAPNIIGKSEDIPTNIFLREGDFLMRAQERNPIYSNSSFVNNIVEFSNTFAYSLGAMLPAIAVSAGISAATGGTGLPAFLAGAANISQTLARKAALTTILTAILNRTNESLLEAYHVKKDVYQHLLSKGFDEERIKKIAAKEALDTFIDNMFYLAVDIPTTLVLFPSVVGKTGSKLLQNVFFIPNLIDKIDNKFLKGLASVSASMFENAFEETYQEYIVQKSLFDAEKKFGLNIEKDIGDLLKEFAFADNTIKTFIFGGLSGPLLESTFKIPAKIGEYFEKRNILNQDKEIKNKYTVELLNYISEINKKLQNNEDITNEVYNVGLKYASVLLYRDLFLGEKRNTTWYRNFLTDLINGLKSGNEEILKQANVTKEEAAKAVEIYEKILNDLNKLEKILDEEAKNNPKDFAFDAARYKFSKQNAEEKLKILETVLNPLYDDILEKYKDEYKPVFKNVIKKLALAYTYVNLKKQIEKLLNEKENLVDNERDLLLYRAELAKIEEEYKNIQDEGYVDEIILTDFIKDLYSRDNEFLSNLFGLIYSSITLNSISNFYNDLYNKTIDKKYQEEKIKSKVEAYEKFRKLSKEQKNNITFEEYYETSLKEEQKKKINDITKEIIEKSSSVEDYLRKEGYIRKAENDNDIEVYFDPKNSSKNVFFKLSILSNEEINKRHNIEKDLLQFLTKEERFVLSAFTKVSDKYKEKLVDKLKQRFEEYKNKQILSQLTTENQSFEKSNEVSKKEDKQKKKSKSKDIQTQKQIKTETQKIEQEKISEKQVKTEIQEIKQEEIFEKQTEIKQQDIKQEEIFKEQVKTEPQKTIQKESQITTVEEAFEKGDIYDIIKKMVEEDNKGGFLFPKVLESLSKEEYEYYNTIVGLYVMRLYQFAFKEIFPNTKEVDYKAISFEDFINFLIKKDIDSKVIYNLWELFVHGWLYNNFATQNDKEKLLKLKEIFEAETFVKLIDDFSAQAAEFPEYYITNIQYTQEQKIKQEIKQEKQKEIKENEEKQKEKIETNVPISDKITEINKSITISESHTINEEEVRIDDIINNFKTVSSDLKLQVLFVDEKGELIDNTEVDKEASLNTQINEVCTITIPNEINSGKNINDIVITFYTPDGEKKSLKFGIFVEKVEKGIIDYKDFGFNSKEDFILAHSPFVVVNDKNKIIAFIPPTTWYNKVNIGLETDEVKQNEIIENGKKNNLLFRKYIQYQNNNGESVKIKIKNITGNYIKIEDKGWLSLYDLNKKLNGKQKSGIGIIRAPYNNSSGKILTLLEFNDDNKIELKDISLIDNKKEYVDEHNKVIYHFIGVEKYNLGYSVEVRYFGETIYNGEKYTIKKVVVTNRINSDGKSFVFKKIVLKTMMYLMHHKDNNVKEFEKAFNLFLNNESNEKASVTFYKNFDNILRYFYIVHVIKDDEFEKDLSTIVKRFAFDKTTEEVRNKTGIVLYKNKYYLYIVDENKNLKIIESKDFPNLSEDEINYIANNILSNISFILFKKETINTKYNFFEVENNNIIKQYTIDYFTYLLLTNRSVIKGYEINDKIYTRIQPVFYIEPVEIEEVEKGIKKITNEEIIEKSKEQNNSEDLEKALNNKQEEKLEEKSEEKLEEIKSTKINIRELNKESSIPESILNDYNAVNKQYDKDKNIKDDEEELLMPFFINDEQSEKLSNDYKIHGISSFEYNVIHYYIVNKISELFFKESKINFDIISKKITFDNIFGETFNEYKETLEKLEKDIEKFEQAKEIINKNKQDYTEEEIKEFEALYTEKLNIYNFIKNRIKHFEFIKNSWDKIIKKSYNDFKETLNIIEIKENETIMLEDEEYADKEAEEMQEEDNEELYTDDDIEIVEKNYNTTSLEINPKLRLSKKIRTLFSGIPKVDNEGIPIQTYFGLIEYMNFDDIYDIVAYLLTKDNKKYYTFEEMINVLKQNIKDFPFLKILIDRLENSPNEIKIKFTTHFIMHLATLKNLKFSVNIDEKNKTSFHAFIYNAMYNDQRKAIVNDFNSAFLNSKLFLKSEGKFFINVNALNEIVKEYEALFGLDEIYVNFDTLDTQLKNSIARYYNKILKNNTEILTKKEINNDNDLRTILQFIKANNKRIKNYITIVINYKDKNGKQTKAYLYISKVIHNNEVAIKISKYKPNLFDNLGYNIINEWLANFNIKLSDKTLLHLARVGIRYVSKKEDGKDKYEYYRIEKLVEYNKSTAEQKPYAIFAILYDFLSKKFDEIKQNNPNAEVVEVNSFFDLTDILKDKIYLLANIEAKYFNKFIPLSITDSNKNLYLITQPKLSTDLTSKLQYDENFVQNLNNIPINYNSITLHFLTPTIDENGNKIYKNEYFKDFFSLHHLSVNAISKIESRIFGENKITKVGEIDNELARIIAFQNMDNPYINSKFLGFATRLISFFFPTMADKTQMYLFNSIGISIKADNIILTKEKIGNKEKEIYTISDEVIDYIFNTLVYPEILRIQQSKKQPSNISGYQYGSLLILTIPELNTLTITNVHNTINNKQLIEILNEDYYNLPEDIKEKINKKIKEFLKDYIRNRIKDKFNEWANYGFIKFEEIEKDGEIIKTTKVVDYIIDKKYLFHITDGNPQNYDVFHILYTALADYIINNMVALYDIVRLYTGDIAFYVQDKTVKKKAIKINNKIIPWKYKTEQDLYDVIKDAYDNMSKRMAMLSASGYMGIYSDNRKILQLMVEDFIEIPNNLDYIASLHIENYEKSEAKNLIDKILDYKQTIAHQEKSGYITDEQEYKENKAILKRLINELTEKYPQIAPFVEIKATDAQQYITAKEAIRQLDLFGKNELAAKIAKQLEEYKLYGKIKTFLSEKEFKEIMAYVQPIKPVYSNVYIDNKNNVYRPVYIKSAIFVLLPQSTIGKEIDKIRKKLEELEEKTGMPVYMSFTSANKVGGIAEPIQIFNIDGSVKDINISDLEKFLVELPFDGYKIQQETPYKAGQNKPTKVAYFSQATKMLFGDATDKLTFKPHVIKTNVEKINGVILKKIFYDIFTKLVENNSENIRILFEIKNSNKKALITYGKNIIKLLLEEAEERNLNKTDIKNIKFKIIKKKGKNYDIEFNIPFWLIPNSSKFEQLFISLAKKPATNIKINGYSFVATSAVGWKTVLEEKDIQNDNIIYTEYYNPKFGLRQYEELKNGYQTVQVFVSSVFKDKNNNLINLLEAKDENGNPKYWEYIDGRKVLKKGVIDEELLRMYSVRIPTSGYLSTIVFEIAGFLPPEQVDSIVVPSNVLVQKGMDFDFDKEYAYIYNYEIDNKNNIKKIDTGKLIIEKNNFKDKGIKLFEEYLIVKNKLLEFANKTKKTIKGKTYYDLIINTLRSKEDYIPAKSYLEEYKAFKKKNKNFNSIKINENNFKKYLQLAKLLKTYSRKVLENRYIEIFETVMNHKEIKKKSIKALSIQNAKETAELIEKYSNENKKLLSFIDPDYQKQTMLRGSFGKKAVGLYSQALVFNSSIQQLEDEVTVEKLNISFIINNPKTNSTTLITPRQLSPIKTLDGERNTTEIFEEKQNVAVDDMKENILAKANINNFTVDVDLFLSMLGVDFAYCIDSYNSDGTINYKKVLIPYLLLSQPIIKDYAYLMRNKNAKFSFNENKQEEEIIHELILKYSKTDKKEEIEFDYEDTENITLDVQKLYDTIKTGNVDDYQITVLKAFLRLKNFYKEINEVILVINPNVSLKKSIRGNYLLLQKIENILFKNIQFKNNVKIKNLYKVFGDVISIENVTDDMINSLIKEGYIEIGMFLVKPQNINSIVLLNALNNINLFKDLYNIYFSDFYNFIIKKIIELSKYTNIIDAENIEKTIAKDLKRFIYNKALMLLTENKIDKEFYRLLVDSEKNQSLASYMFTLLKNYSKLLDNYILLKKLMFTINDQNSGLSTIKFLKTGNNYIDETEFYASIAKMISDKLPLPPYNYETSSLKEINFNEIFENEKFEGEKEYITDKLLFNEIGGAVKFEYNNNYYKATLVRIEEKKEGETIKYNYVYNVTPFYTTKDLALDLVKYTILTNLDRFSTDITRYIPLLLFDQLGILDRIKNIEKNLYSILNEFVYYKKELLNGEVEIYSINNFIIQFFQNNPDFVKNLRDLKILSKENVNILDYIIFKHNNKLYVLISDEQIFEKVETYTVKKKIDGQEKEFKYIVLDIINYPYIYNYDPGKIFLTNIKNDKKEIKIESVEKAIEQNIDKKQNSIEAERNKLLHYIKKKDFNGIISTILNSPYVDTFYKKIINLYIKLNISDLKIELYEKLHSIAIYIEERNTIKISFNDIIYYDFDSIVKILVHEFIHAITSKFVNKYISDTISKDAPEYVQELYDIFIFLRKNFDKFFKIEGMPSDIDEALKQIEEKMKKEDYRLTNDELAVYYLSNINEFIAAIFTDKYFIDKLRNIKYKSNKKETLFDKIKRAIFNLLKRLGILDDIDNVYSQALINSVMLIHDEKYSIKLKKIEKVISNEQKNKLIISNEVIFNSLNNKQKNC